MNEIKTSYDTAKDDGVASLSAAGSASSTTVPCELEDIVPIYPVRIAWGDLNGDVNANFTYPTSLAAFSAPNSPSSTAGFALRQLRGGHVMIYDINANVWSAFTYTRDDTPAGGAFTHQTWKSGGTEWVQCAAATPFVHVPDSATEIYICFIEHFWSTRTMRRAHFNTNGFRDKVMTRVRLASPSNATFSAPLAELPGKVEEFSPNGLVQTHQDWNALSESPGLKLHPNALLGTVMANKKKVPPIMVALHDPAGVALELAMCHSNRMAVRAEYLQANAYALATARATKVMQNHAASELLNNRTLGFFEKRALRKWGEAIRPERDSFLVTSEQTLLDHEVTIAGPLDAWQKYFEMGLKDPTGTPGSVQTHLLHFDPESDYAREVAALGRFAHDCIASIISSQAGQERLSKVVMAPDRWTEQLNPLKAFMSVTSAGLSARKEYLQYKADIVSAADDLLRDISLPMAAEITKFQRVDRLEEINRFTSVIYQRTVQRVNVDIDNAMSEVNRRPRATQTTMRVNRNQSIHRIQTPLLLYKFDGVVHVSGHDSVSALGAVGAGFGIFANSLNMLELISATERSKLSGRFGAIGSNPYLGLTLTTIDTMNQFFDLSTRVKDIAGVGDPRRYRISGTLSRAQLTALMKGKTVTDDLVKTLIESGKVNSVARAVAAPPRTMMAALGAKVLSGAGIALGVLDLFNAAESFRRGDSIATVSNIALGVGAILMAGGALMGLSTSYTIVGAVAGLILVILGAVLSFFIDDPVTAWLKNGYWGTSRYYLYWEDRNRAVFIAASCSAHEGQRNAIVEEREGYDIPKYFAREMQQFNEFVYSPQNVPDPPYVRSYETNIFGIKKRPASPHSVFTISFRLPNYIEGYSAFEGKIIAVIYAESDYRRDSNIVRWNVSKDFWESATYGPGDIVTGTFPIKVPGNANNIPADDIKWELLRVELDEGWLYTPLPGLILPRKYDDDFFGGGWKDEGAGKGEKLVISG